MDKAKSNIYVIFTVVLLSLCLFVYLVVSGSLNNKIEFGLDSEDNVATTTPIVIVPTLDRELYDRLMNGLANYPVKIVATTTATTTITATSTTIIIVTTATTTTAIATTTVVKKPWPVDAPYPNVGAILPFNRIIAYYGNFYSGALGVLGAYPPEEMLQRLMGEVSKWQIADPSTRVIPALDYIAVTAQGSAGSDGMYRARMPASEIQKAVDLADTVGGLVILDIQVGKSTLQEELPPLEQFLKLPNVELAIDPEFSMKDGTAPGKRIGTFDAADINFSAEYLAQIVKQYNIPPKVLIIQRFTENMITNYNEIRPLPEVQILIDMDGYGTPAQKKKVYRQVVQSEPVQFTGLKLFYKNDVANNGVMMTPEEVMTMQPRPSFIQYQ